MNNQWRVEKPLHMFRNTASRMTHENISKPSLRMRNTLAVYSLHLMLEFMD